MADQPNHTGLRPDARVGLVLERLLAPVVVVTPGCDILYANHAAAEALDRSPACLVGRNILDFVHPAGRRSTRRSVTAVVSGRKQTRAVECRLRGSEGRDWRTFELFATNLLDEPGVNGILLAGRDVTEQRAYERQLRDAAYRDPLTALPNRLQVTETLDRLLKGAVPVAVCFTSLDRLRMVNDSLGHSTGDAVLQVAAGRITQSLPVSCLAGRFSGDVFAVIAPGEVATGAGRLAWRMVRRLGEPMFLRGHELRLTASAGVVYGDETSTTESLLRHADLALHRAKERGGGRVEEYEESMYQAALSRLRLEADLRQAVQQSELALALQPIVDLGTRESVEAEALLRWNGGSPSEVIKVAEESGLIVPLGDWVIERAAQMTASSPYERIQVNLSGRQLTSPGLADRIGRALSVHGPPPRAMGFEVTESMLIEEYLFTAGVLRSIRDLGCRVGLDDFGTGYSSLSYLRRLPIDFLKIDRSLIQDVHVDAQARAIVGAVVGMAQALGLDVIAEGIEEEAQARVLADIGCTHGQGFLFGQPTVH